MEKLVHKTLTTTTAAVAASPVAAPIIIIWITYSIIRHRVGFMSSYAGHTWRADGWLQTPTFTAYLPLASSHLGDIFTLFLSLSRHPLNESQSSSNCGTSWLDMHFCADNFDLTMKTVNFISSPCPRCFRFFCYDLLLPPIGIECLFIFTFCCVKSHNRHRQAHQVHATI